MSIRVDSTSLIAGALVCGNRGLGVLGSAVPSTGTHGPSILYNDIDAGEGGAEFLALILTKPAGGSIFFDEDGSFEASGFADGSYTGTYEGFRDGVSYGVAGYGFQVGAEATEVSSDITTAYAVRATVSADQAASWTVRSAVASDLAIAAWVHAPVAADAQLQWPVHHALERDLGAAWPVHAAVAADLEAAYAARARVESDLGLGWSVEADGLSSVASDMPVGYAVHAPVAADLEAAIAVRKSAQADIAAAWAVRRAVEADLAAEWGVVGEVLADLALAFRVQSIGGAGAEDVWAYVLPNGMTAEATVVEIWRNLRIVAAVSAGKTTIEKRGGRKAHVEFSAVDGDAIVVAADMVGSERVSVAVTP